MSVCCLGESWYLVEGWCIYVVVGRILVYLWCLAEGWCGVWKVHISVVVSDERLVCLCCLMED